MLRIIASCCCVLLILADPSADLAAAENIAKRAADLGDTTLQAAKDDDAKGAVGEGEGESEAASETQNLLNDLAIHMGGEVIDERTFIVRDSASTARGGKKKIRLGNVAPIEKGSMSDEEYAEKVEAAKNALTQFVDKQMIFFKEAPAEAQPVLKEGEPEPEIPMVVSNIWTIDGRHVNTILAKAGHLAKTEDYVDEMAKDILTAAADDSKRDQYKKLEEALAENEKAKKEAKAKQQEEEAEAEDVEYFGLAGWLGMIVMIVLVVGALTNFGRPKQAKRLNLNKKKGFFDGLMSKVKGN